MRTTGRRCPISAKPDAPHSGQACGVFDSSTTSSIYEHSGHRRQVSILDESLPKSTESTLTASPCA